MLPPTHPSLLTLGPLFAPGDSLGPALPGRSMRQGALREHRQSLQRHVLQCRQARSRWNGLGCAAELVHGMLAPRFVTTVMAVAIVLALSAWWM